MGGQTTRRGFIRTATAAGGCLVVPQLVRAAGASSRAAGRATGPGSEATDSGEQTPRAAFGGPIAVVTGPAAGGKRSRAAAPLYVTEILKRAGVFFHPVGPSGLAELVRRRTPIVLLAGDLPLAENHRDALATLVQQGSWLIGIGGTSGLDEVFGVGGQRPLAEGWIRVAAPDHPVTRGLRSSLHVFGGHVVQPGAATTLANVESGPQGARGSAVVENPFGKGGAILIGPDLAFSVVHIQQGLPVFQDGKPAPDGSAPINDGELKAEDGLVLDWDRDRSPMPPEGTPAFLEPASDELREIILKAVFHAASQQGVALPVLWYWPRGLPAVGHISHDTDGNDPERAVALHEVMGRCGVKSTWCTLYPGGYPREFYGTLKDSGSEIALHYDARTGGPQTSWSRANFVLQHQWLIQEAGLEHITTNKNHYTRWENRLDFFRWCEEIGVPSDQTRGPSKRGTIGFPLGGSQPYYPLDAEADSPRFLEVLEVNLLTQDLVITCPAAYGRRLMDSVLRHHGVAHFLFHPAHILKPGVADALADLVDYGRSQGVPWWTSEQILAWERLRRGVEAAFTGPDRLCLHAGNPVAGATLLLLKPGNREPSVRVDGRPAALARQEFCGFDFQQIVVDLKGRVEVQLA